MRIQTGSFRDLTLELMTQIGAYRHQVFVEMLGWKLASEHGLEFDQFDRADTLYLVVLEDERVVGTARLLPTTRPYLLGEIFPQLLAGAPLPCTPRVWEISRFAAVDLRAGRAGALSRFSSPVAAALLRSAIDTVAERGGERLISVSPVGIERLLRKAGFQVSAAGAPTVVDGRALFACVIDCHTDAGRVHSAGIATGNVRQMTL